ncbi:spliceosomal snRNP assembly [Nakaseomyces bracarensis]|uniref:Spliceosomal snRNP assembly n=1 Tax=Nakaseomyces bracarensis TaxID=273131 RepID=A0ABR4NP44_9SACH
MNLKLTNFLRKLHNQHITLELKNGSTLHGTLITVSGRRNISLGDVTLLRYHNGAYIPYTGATPPPTTSTSHLKVVNVKESTVRQVILPDSVDLDALLVGENELNGLKRLGVLSDLGGNRKRRRRSSADNYKRARG